MDGGITPSLLPVEQLQLVLPGFRKGAWPHALSQHTLAMLRELESVAPLPSKLLHPLIFLWKSKSFSLL